MKKNELENVLKELNIEENKWNSFNKIESISLKNNIEIYPNFLYMRFKYRKGKIYIQYGRPEFYGARLSGNSIALSRDGMTLILNSNFSNTYNFYEFSKIIPKVGDIITVLKQNKVILETGIMSINSSSNGIYIDLSSPIFYENGISINFYDPLKRKEDSIHNLIPGVYFNFIPKKIKRFNKIIEAEYEQKIPARKIREIKIFKGGVQ